MPRGVVIALYHHISDETDPLTSQLGVATRPDIFEKHVKYFAQNFDLVSGSDLVNEALPPRALLVTFDDAYRSVIDTAGAILRDAKAPSIFFVNPATLLGDSLPIDNIISLAIEELGLEPVANALNAGSRDLPSTAHLFTNIVPRMNQKEVGAAKKRLCLAMGTTEAQIRQASNLFLGTENINTLRNFGIEVGNHSMSHTFFRSLSPTELETEISESRTILEALSGRHVPYLSIPYGNTLDATVTALAAARRSGHKAIFLVHAKSNLFPPAPDIYYRVSLGNTPVEKLPFKLQIMPLMRSVRDWLW